MKILLVHQYFKFPEEGSGIRSWYIARELVQMGHQVTVLSGHNVKQGLENHDFAIQYFRIPYDNNFGFWKRIMAFYSFVRHSKWYLKKDHDFDMAYVLTTPLTTGMVALHLKKKYQIILIFTLGLTLIGINCASLVDPLKLRFENTD